MRIITKIRNLIIFVSGFGFGFGVCFIALKEWFKNKAEEENSEVKTAFKERLDELEGKIQDLKIKTMWKL